jgi:hypothetical protein
MDIDPRNDDPSGPPEPERRPADGGLTIALAAGGVVLVLVAMAAQPTMGATRSARLRWEARQREAQESASNPGAEAPGARPEEPRHDDDSGRP